MMAGTRKSQEPPASETEVVDTEGQTEPSQASSKEAWQEMLAWQSKVNLLTAPG